MWELYCNSWGSCLLWTTSCRCIWST